MIRRGLLLFIGTGLLGLLSGCHGGCHVCQGRCDCLVQPLDHGTPPPFVPPVSQSQPPIAPVPAH